MKSGPPRSESELANVCASFQRAVVEVLVLKSIAACKEEDVPHLVLTGGVAANSGLRQHALEVCNREGISLYVPPFASCTDNAAMIAYVGALALVEGDRSDIGLAPFARDPERHRGRFHQDGSWVGKRVS